GQSIDAPSLLQCLITEAVFIRSQEDGAVPPQSRAEIQGPVPMQGVMEPELIVMRPHLSQERVGPALPVLPVPFRIRLQAFPLPEITDMPVQLAGSITIRDEKITALRTRRQAITHINMMVVKQVTKARISHSPRFRELEGAQVRPVRLIPV